MELLPVASLLMLVSAGLAIMLLDVFARGRAELPFVTTIALLAAAATSAAGLFAPTPTDVPSFITDYLSVDKYGLFFDVVIALGAALASLLAGGYLREHGMDRGEYYVLTLFSALGAMVMARAVDLLTLFVGLETLSLGVYSLVAYRRTSARATEAAVKYFLLGSFASAIFLFGAALVYGATGHTDFHGIGEVIDGGHAPVVLVVIGLAMLVAGLGFKVSAVPFHMWTPDAYEGAPTSTTAFMSVVVKTAAFAVFLRLLAVGFGGELRTGINGWPGLLSALSAVTMVYGNLAAVTQTSVKRMLAYSSIAHAGYLLLGLAAVATQPEQATSAVLYYLAAYTVSNALVLGALIWSGSFGKEATSYADLAGLGRRHPAVGAAFIVGILSLMGFPPTAGFFGKWYVLSAAVQADMVPLTILAVLSSAVGAFYYLKVLVFLYMKSPEEGAPVAVPMKSGYVTFALVLAAYFVMKMGLTPSNYLDAALAAASGLVS
ncbi:MAG: NADH-quinone oxidoreductase subunit N [Sandaracinaceae bacterium]|nr:NADH-quinone oxidoreductase subunit N [Myxococcales bacterium]MCB9661567.1 NADH-quinone oxidoreductase subunit N [Sandaracinaceae bacterium]